MEILYQNLLAFDMYDLIMIGIGCLLVYLAIAKEMEPSLLLPMGFGAILVNIPFSDALVGPIQELYHAGIANELFPLLLFIGIGAMIRPPADQPQADAFRRCGPVRHLLHSVHGKYVLPRFPGLLLHRHHRCR